MDLYGHLSLPTTMKGKLISKRPLRSNFRNSPSPFDLSDPMTSTNAPRRWCHNLAEISRKIRNFLRDLLMLLANNDEKGKQLST